MTNLACCSHGDVINFLNEVAEAFPCAVPLAAGRPTERFSYRLDSRELLEAHARYLQGGGGQRDPLVLGGRLLQYGPTAGIINDLVLQQLHTDEGIPTHFDRALITAGCQEALALCLPTLCPDPGDTLLVLNPTYIGATAIARASGIQVFPIPNGYTDLLEGIDFAVRTLHQNGRRPRVLYLIPTFDNPTGRVLDESVRRALLSLCVRYRIVILEDNPYGMFRYDSVAIAPMAALDESGCVIYLSTFSKTIAPALRIGAATLPRTLFGDRGASATLWNSLVQRKSYLTVNTSQITQAIVGGLLLSQNGSLQRWVQAPLAWYRNNRDAMLRELDSVLPSVSSRIRWNRPSGGFFIAMDLPFRFNGNAAAECAAEDGVIVMPMSFFALDNSQDHRIRLSFSAVDPEQIRVGISSLARYLAKRIRQPVATCERFQTA